MNIISIPRCGGKTHAMLEWAKDAPEGEVRVIVCFTAMESMRLLRESRRQGLGLESWQFVSAEEARHLTGHPYRGDVALGIDNLDLWLSMHFGRPVRVATVNS